MFDTYILLISVISGIVTGLVIPYFQNRNKEKKAFTSNCRHEIIKTCQGTFAKHYLALENLYKMNQQEIEKINTKISCQQEILNLKFNQINTSLKEIKAKLDST